MGRKNKSSKSNEQAGPNLTDIGVQVDDKSFATIAKGKSNEPHRSSAGRTNKTPARDNSKTEDSKVDETLSSKGSTESGKPEKGKSHVYKDNNADEGDTTSDDDDGQAHSGKKKSRHNGSLHRDNSGLDLKGMVEFYKMCCMLRTNVRELRAMYEKRRKAGYIYTDIEEATMDYGLCCLEEAVERLLKNTETSDGRCGQMKCMEEKYKKFETQYRELRDINKVARLRNEQRDSICSITEMDQRSGNTLRAILQKFLCRPCYLMFTRFNAKNKARNC